MRLEDVQISSLMTRDPLRVQKEQSLLVASQLMVTHGIRHLPVVHDGWVEGILSQRDVLAVQTSALERGLDEEATSEREMTVPVARAMVRPVVTASPEQSALTVARLMHQRRIGCVPLVDGWGWLAGIVTTTDLVRLCVRLLAQHAPVAVEDVMVRQPLCLGPDDRLSHIESRMLTQGFRHVPIVDVDLHPLGMVSHRDVLRWRNSVLEVGSSFPAELSAAEVMSRELITVEASDDLAAAGRALLDHQIGAVPVVSHGIVVGIVTSSDLLGYLLGTLAASSLRAAADAPVHHYMTSPVQTVGCEDSLLMAALLVKARRISSVVVVDGARTVGVLTRSDLFHGVRLREEATVSDHMTRHVLEVGPATPIGDACRDMIEHEVHQLVVTDGERPIGVLSRSDAVGAARDLRLPDPVTRWATPTTFMAEVDQPVRSVLELLDQAEVGTVLIMDGRFPVGVFGPRERVSIDDTDLDRPIESVMSTRLVVLPGDLPLHRAAAQMVATGVELAAVLNQEPPHYCVLTPSDVVRALAAVRY